MHAIAVAQRDLRKLAFLSAQREANGAIDIRAAAAKAGTDDGVTELIDLAIGQQVLPDWINVNYEIDYLGETKSAVIDFNLPSPDMMPTLKEVKYIAARDEFIEKYISDADRSKLYDDMLYQIALRILGATFAAESDGCLQRVTFNGWVDYVDRASGLDERACIMTLGANRSDFAKVDLERVEPKECFRSLKGVAASKLIGLAAVPPLERPRGTDRRLIESRDVATSVDVSVNIAAMDWKDFEHLVRQVFESEFSSANAEVRVTQASRDGGVDAIVFDPDPIRGGKIVIQAKRYVNTVDVGSVRDLYGTVLNEGASKGILVTTSNFGPDARKFAQGKPLTLVDGGTFLYLLEKMGVAARINLKEAKELMRAEQQG